MDADETPPRTTTLFEIGNEARTMIALAGSETPGEDATTQALPRRSHRIAIATAAALGLLGGAAAGVTCWASLRGAITAPAPAALAPVAPVPSAVVLPRGAGVTARSDSSGDARAPVTVRAVPERGPQAPLGETTTSIEPDTIEPSAEREDGPGERDDRGTATRSSRRDGASRLVPSHDEAASQPRGLVSCEDFARALRRE